MPRSSRSKSHKQSKHSSDEDVKMKDRSSNGGSDRWNGGSTDDKESNKDSVKVVEESKSGRSGRRHDGDEKRKYDKESGRKESSQYNKEYKESKDKDRGSDRGRRGHSDKDGTEASGSKRGKEITGKKCCYFGMLICALCICILLLLKTPDLNFQSCY